MLDMSINGTEALTAIKTSLASHHGGAVGYDDSSDQPGTCSWCGEATSGHSSGMPIQTEIAGPAPAVDEGVRKAEPRRMLGLKMYDDDFLRQLAHSEPAHALPQITAEEPACPPPQPKAQPQAQPKPQKPAVRPSMGHVILAAHACTLATLQGIHKGDMSDFRHDAIANAAAVTPLGEMLLRDYVMPERSS